MAKLVKIFVLMMPILAYACIETEFTSIYYFENKSGVDVYIPEHGLRRNSIFIKNNDTYVLSGSDMGQEINPFGYAEDIDVIFDGNRIIHYNIWDEDKINNPLDYSNYERVDVTKNSKNPKYKYYYTFTVEQYESAEPYDPEE